MKVISWIVGIGVLAALAVVLYLATLPPPLTVQGEVSADRVDISPRVSGRIAELNAAVGDTVEKGAVIATLDNPQLQATVLASDAALAVAKADNDRINSTRPETIAARKAELAAAVADVTLYQETYDRQAHLVKNGNTPQSRVDEATRNLEAAIRKQREHDRTLGLLACPDHLWHALSPVIDRPQHDTILSAGMRQASCRIAPSP